MKIKLWYFLSLFCLFVFALTGCDIIVSKQKLIMGTISYEKNESIIHWQKVDNAIGYDLAILGAGITEPVNIRVDESFYNDIASRYQYNLTTGVEGKQFTVKLIAVGDEVKYSSSDEVTKSFTVKSSLDVDYSSNPYYANLGLEDATDSEVKLILHKKLSDYTQVSYGDARYAIVAADVSLENPNKIYGIYNGMLFDKIWDGNKINREHVWPCARLGVGRPNNNTKAISSDLHNLRVIQPSINSSRSDRYFVQGPTLTPEKVGADGFYPGPEHAGDVARICFYMATMYLDLTLVNEANLPNAAAYTKENAFMGDLEALLRWHLEDPVDQFEIYRNEILFGYQKNRNPYIDFPDLVERVFEVDNSQLSDQVKDIKPYKIVSVSLISAVYVNQLKNDFLN